jgi:hypothetical protein
MSFAFDLQQIHSKHFAGQPVFKVLRDKLM